MKKLIAPAVILVLVAVAAFMMFDSEDRKTLTAEFPRTISVYEGSDVRVLGIPVGTVDTVEPDGDTVKVTMSYDAEIDLPADAKAVIVSPSVVGDRFVQITPVYQGGQKLADGATLTTEDTATPLELDEIYQSIDDLTVALGPEGANSEGALTELLDVTAENFDGQGKQFNQTVKDLGKLTGTLENNKDELFGTAEELDAFLSTLANNDKVVRQFNASMSSVSKLLAGERQELRTALKNLGGALGQVKTFVQDNKDLLSKNIKGLNKVSKTLVRRRGELNQILRVAPVALNNLGLTYNPQTGTLDTSANLENAVHEATTNPGLFLCSIVGQTDKSGQLCNLIEQILPRTGAFGAGAVDDPIFSKLLEVTR